ncbi:ABC-type cobalt transport system, permease component CbiQ and related transporters [uncultured Eubacteriales bacterium]|uniref:ABC-type cobalt transport system, permease component CbiQ and related transporters n=1 Tax=uncultured Eubacteriales bacterium TaxID=172733 RepID=A0A212JDT1_9FIRM|nr:ABC-type cobalt transport system, permease component CbiQ and related transporters [uncultured Eubacteriales bacterium]
MRNGILQADIENRGLALDPRTKILLLITMTTFVLGGAGGEELWFLTPCLCALPLLLLLTSKRFTAAAIYTVVYAAAYVSFMLLGHKTAGIANYLLLGTAGIITRFLPSLMLGVYVVSTTTVSEFTAAMLRLRLSEKLIIPLSVMFRFFPTVGDEFSSINAAMRMRDIRFGGRNASKMLEYRLIPLLSCSVKIGDELSAAALTRGLGGSARRTNVCEIGFHIQDIVLLLLCGAAFACLILSLFGVL